MKKLFSISIFLVVSISAFAQCNPATIKDLRSVFSKGYEPKYKSPEQGKWLNTIFSSVFEPALKSTKGLRGTWKPEIDFEPTPEGLNKSVLGSYMFTMGCKDNKVYNKNEQGLVINFNLNSFKNLFGRGIAEPCSHEETKWKNPEDSKTIYVNDVLDGRQIYFLQSATVTRDYSNIAYYRKEADGEYFLICKEDVPLFIPLTVRQALEINKKNYTNLLNERKKFAATSDSQFWIDYYTNQIKLVVNYLKNTPAKELEKPCNTRNGAILISLFGNDTDNTTSIQSNFQDTTPSSEGPSGGGVIGTLVTLNPAYFNNSFSKSAPQFISVELRIQGNSAVALKAYYDFKSNLDLEKLKSLLVK